MEPLKRHLEFLLSRDLTPCSKQLYKRAYALYEQFSKKHFPGSPQIPVSADRLALFIVYLHANGYAPASVSSYVSALGYIHRLNNMSDPTDVFIIKRLLRSVHKTSAKGDSRLPITEAILVQLLQSLPHVTQTHYDRVLFHSMFLLAFYAFLRIGEITIQSHQAKNNIQYNCVKFF